ncbi:MAG: DUF1501 domain-containing protein [Sphingomonas sp.]
MLDALTRRHIIAGAALSAGIAVYPGLAHAQVRGPKRFLFIIQRGAADGLAMLQPTGDPAFASLRRDQIEAAGTRIGSFFTLHPALAAIATMQAAGQARFYPAVGSVYRDRSHFDGQNVLEGGGSRPYGRQDGWMNRLIALLPDADRSALAIAEAVPLALRGPANVTSYAPSRLPAASDDLLMRVGALYASDPQLHALWENAQRTRAIAGDLGGNNGRNGAELGTLAATLMRPADGARIAMIETGGWDTHSGQRGRLAAQLRGLDALVDAFKTGVGDNWSSTLVIVATEFGRTAALNGTGGTDHGTASLAMVLGGGLPSGSPIIGDWPGLNAGQLHEGRDLRAAASLEGVIADALADHYGLEPGRVRRALYPDLT